MQTSRNNPAIFSSLNSAGIDPSRLKAFIEHYVEIEQAVLSATSHVLPENDQDNKRLTIAEAQILCILLDRD